MLWSTQWRYEVHGAELTAAVANKQAAKIHTAQPQPVTRTALTFWQTVLPVSVKPGLAVAAEAGGIVGAEGVLGALSVVVFAGFLVGSIIREDWKAETSLH